MSKRIYNERVPQGKIYAGQVYLIPSRVNKDHIIKCPWKGCKGSIRPVTDWDFSKTQDCCDGYYNCHECSKAMNIYKCKNCNTIAALPGKLGKVTRKCRCCNTNNLTRKWCLNEYSDFV